MDVATEYSRGAAGRVCRLRLFLYPTNSTDAAAMNAVQETLAGL